MMRDRLFLENLTTEEWATALLEVETEEPMDIVPGVLRAVTTLMAPRASWRTNRETHGPSGENDFRKSKRLRWTRKAG